MEISDSYTAPDLCRVLDRPLAVASATDSTGLASGSLVARKISKCGRSSASSTSGYEDSSDGEDNHSSGATSATSTRECPVVVSSHLSHYLSSQRQQLGAGLISLDHQGTEKSQTAATNHHHHLSHHHHHHKHDSQDHDKGVEVELSGTTLANDADRKPHYDLDQEQSLAATTRQPSIRNRVIANQQLPLLTTNVIQTAEIRPLGLSLLPIDDFDDFDQSYRYSHEERQVRIKMTAVYRLIEIYGWSMGIYNHVTAKVQGDHEHLLIHPFGLHYNEITASSMLKIDMAGNIVDQGSTNFELNRPGYLVHSAVHMTRPDVGAVIHLHYPPVAAASAFKFGLLPICQEQALLGEVRYLDYSGILTDEDEREAVAQGLGPTCKVMILRNHGLIVCGETIEEAFYLLQNLMKACETQARLLAIGGLESVTFMSNEAAYQAYDLVQNARYAIKTFKHDKCDKRNGQIVGYVNMFELDFEAQMRSLDHAGHQTGYQYKRPLVRNTRTGKKQQLARQQQARQPQQHSLGLVSPQAL